MAPRYTFKLWEAERVKISNKAKGEIPSLFFLPNLLTALPMRRDNSLVNVGFFCLFYS